MGTVVTIVVALLVLVVLAVLVGKLLKGNRSEAEQVQEDNDQAAYLASIDKPHSRVNDLTSPVTGRYERKGDPVVPRGSRKIKSSTPGLAGNGPLTGSSHRVKFDRDNDNSNVVAAGTVGYGLGASQDYDVDGLPNSVDPVDLNQYDVPTSDPTPSYDSGSNS